MSSGTQHVSMGIWCPIQWLGMLYEYIHHVRVYGYAPLLAIEREALPVNSHTTCSEQNTLLFVTPKHVATHRRHLLRHGRVGEKHGRRSDSKSHHPCSHRALPLAYPLELAAVRQGGPGSQRQEFQLFDRCRESVCRIADTPTRVDF